MNFPQQHPGAGPHAQPQPHPADLHNMSQQFANMNVNGRGSPVRHMNGHSGPEIIDVGPSSRSTDFRRGFPGSSMKGFIIRRMPAPPGERMTWQRSKRQSMTIEELERELLGAQRAAASVSKAIQDLKPNMHAQVMQVAKDLTDADPDPRASWDVVSLRRDKKQKGTGFGSTQETTAMRVIVRRTIDDTAAAMRDPRRGQSGWSGGQQQQQHHQHQQGQGQHGMQGDGRPSMPPQQQQQQPGRPEQPMPFNNGPPPLNGRDPREMPVNGGMRPDMGMPPNAHGPQVFNPREQQPPPPPMHPGGGGGGVRPGPGPGGYPGGDPAMGMRGGPGGPGGPMGHHPGMAGGGGPGGQMPPNRNFMPTGPQPLPPMMPPHMMPPGAQPMPGMRPHPMNQHGRPQEPMMPPNRGPMPKRSNPALRNHGGPRRSDDIIAVVDSDYDSYSSLLESDEDESPSTLPSSPGSHRAKLVGTTRAKQPMRRAKPTHQQHRRHHSHLSGKAGVSASTGRRSPDHLRRHRHDRRRSDVELLEDVEREEMLEILRRGSIGRDVPGIRRSGSIKSSLFGARQSADDHLDELRTEELRMKVKRLRERAAVELTGEAERLLERERALDRGRLELERERERERRMEAEMLRQAQVEAIREDAIREVKREDELQRERILEERERQRAERILEERQRRDEEDLRERIREEARLRGAATARHGERIDRQRRTTIDPLEDDLRMPPLRERRRGLGFF
ncbi:MAG: hypothetical protein M1823_001856 [Watsoniomyces obsoletus]|nr:MAG: hypothetical protein M1823_001856 [Watsoniomyces obsoletus]